MSWSFLVRGSVLAWVVASACSDVPGMEALSSATPNDGMVAMSADGAGAVSEVAGQPNQATGAAGVGAKDAASPASGSSDGSPAVTPVAAAGTAASAPVAAGGTGALNPAAGSSASAGMPAVMPATTAGTTAAGTSGSAAAGDSAAGSGETDNTDVEPASCVPDGAGSKVPVIYVIGDSTASAYDASLYPRMGWAQPLQEYFRLGCATVQDKALSGRSSKSFYDEGAWTPIRNALREGDYVLIQFGHNDEKREDAARYTEPFGSYQEHLTVYIDDTLAAQATPILMTSIERNKWSNGMLSATHGDYPEAVRQLAKARDLTLVDMTTLTHTYLESIGQTAASKLYMNLALGEHPNYPMGSADDTHLQERGAHIVAQLALADLARQRTPIAALLDHIPDPQSNR